MFKPLKIKRSSKFGSNFWEVFSVKENRIIQLYGDLQYYYWILIEADPKIRNFCESPIVPKYLKLGKEREPYFDAWILWEDNSEEFIKIHRLCDLNHINSSYESTLKILNLKEKWCKENGFKFSIKTENEIKCNLVLLENLKHIISFTRNKSYEVEIDTRKVIKAVYKGLDTIIQIEQFLSEIPKYRVKEAIYWLIFKGRLLSDINIKSLSPNTKVWIQNDEKIN